VLTVIYPYSQSIPAADRGLAYGDGLFETIRMSGQKAVLRRYHITRMASDALRLGIMVDPAELDNELARAAAKLAPPDDSAPWILKLILTRGSGGRGYRPPDLAEPHLIVSAAAMPPMPDPEGVIARLASFPLTVNPQLAGIKTLNRLEQVMASREFTGSEWEMIMANSQGDLVEGTRTNLLARFADEWVTPPVASIAVAGVMRQYAMECLRARGHVVAERPLATRPGNLPGFRGLYLLNSVFGAVPVRSLDAADLPVDGTLATIFNLLDTLE
jgi:4-amino-4-deoxychorismate lyase